MAPPFAFRQKPSEMKSSTRFAAPSLSPGNRFDAADQTPYRWVILALVWLLYVCHGIVSRSPSPLVSPIMKDLHLSYGQMGMVLGSWQLTYLLVAIFIGLVVDRWGLRKSLFFGVSIIGISATLRFFAQGFISLMLMVALFGVGGSMLSIGLPKTVSQWFVGRDRGTAVGIYTTGAWVGQFIVLAVTNSLVMPLTGYSWRLTFVGYGVFCFGVALLWWLFGREAHRLKTTQHLNFMRVVVRLFKVRNVNLILMSGLLTFAILHGFVSWLPTLLENYGISPTNAGLYASLPFLFAIPSVLIIPRRVPPRHRGLSIAVMSLFSVTGILTVSSTVVPLWVGLALYGITAPALLPMLILILMETPEVGSEYMGAAGGLFFCIAEIGGFLGPFMMGVLVDLTGLFLAGAAFLALLGGAVFGLMFFLKK